jgi:hypothetical protein
MSKRKPKRVVVWAWAVVSSNADTLIFFDEVEAKDKAMDLNEDPTTEAEVIDLVPRAESNPREAAEARLGRLAIKRHEAWLRVACEDSDSADVDAFYEATRILAAAIERLERRK